MSDLAEQIDALLELNVKGVVSHPVPGLAVELLERARDTLSALLPVDGLEVVAHAYVVEGECEQIEWGSDVLLPDDPSLVELTPLSQASSVIAGLKAEVADLRDEWQAEYDARLAANTARRAAEARISFLEEENKRLREIVKAVAHIGVDFGFGPYELEHHFIEDARKALEDHNG